MKQLFTIMLFLSIFSLPGILWAADPIIGTWKLNVTKSNHPPNEEPPKELTEIYHTINGELIDFIYEVIQADGSIILWKATWPAEGGVISTPEGQLAPGRSYVETLLKPGNWCVTVLQDGKQISTIHKVVGEDGRTMTQKITFVDEEGEKLDILRVYEKQ